jgi:hypothetical protein
MRQTVRPFLIRSNEVEKFFSGLRQKYLANLRSQGKDLRFFIVRENVLI